MEQSFKSHELFKASSSEKSCKQNTSPETLQPLILGLLQTMTGLPDWHVVVENVPVADVGDMLQVRAVVNMSIPKARIGAEPEQPFLPPKEVA